MPPPLFLTLGELLEMHRDQLERYGGSPGVRDVALLESAAAMPSAGFGSEYLHADLYKMAAAYLFHLVRNHPFVDGNKRVGTVAAIVFLELNGIELDVDDEDLETLVLSVAQGNADKEAIADFLRSNSAHSSS